MNNKLHTQIQVFFYGTAVKGTVIKIGKTGQLQATASLVIKKMLLQICCHVPFL